MPVGHRLTNLHTYVSRTALLPELDCIHYTWGCGATPGSKFAAWLEAFGRRQFALRLPRASARYCVLGAECYMPAAQSSSGGVQTALLSPRAFGRTANGERRDRHFQL